VKRAPFDAAVVRHTERRRERGAAQRQARRAVRPEQWRAPTIRRTVRQLAVASLVVSIRKRKGNAHRQQRQQ
jgi:hypothetical protein